MSERELKLSVIEKAEVIAKLLCRGKDVEIRKDAGGVKIIEVRKTVMR